MAKSLNLLSDLLAGQVSKRSRSRGYSYFVSGAVHGLAVHDGIIAATVYGSQPYDVTLEPNGEALRVSCTCPYAYDQLEICKHVWATLLAAEDKNLPLVAPRVNRSLVCLELADEDGADLADFDDWEFRSAPPAPEGSRRRPAPQPAWQLFLDTVATRPADTAAAGRPTLSAGGLLYAIDVAASIASGVLVMELMTRDRKANGDWGKPRPARLTTVDIQVVDDGAERKILERLRGARPDADWQGYGDSGTQLWRFRLPALLAADMLPAICGTGRCVARVTLPNATPTSQPSYSWMKKPDPPALLPIAWDDGPPWRFALTVRRDDAAAAYVIEGGLLRENSRMEVGDPLIALDGVLVTKTHAARLDHDDALIWLAALRRMPRVTVPLDERLKVIDALLARTPPIADLPDELRIEIVDGTPKPCVRVRRRASRPDHVAAELAFDYDGLSVPPDLSDRIVRDAQSRRAIRRDLERERTFAAVLHSLGCRNEWDYEAGRHVLQLAATLLPRLVRTLLAEGWRIEGTAGVYRAAGAVSLRVNSGIDWFELHGQVDYGSQTASLPQLLAALERGESFVTLGDGTIGVLPEEWLRKHGLLVRLGAADGDHVRFRRSQVALLDALLEAQPHADCDETFARARTEIRRFDGIRPADAPATFTGVLRAYQREGLGWLTFLQRFGFGGCLADDMGLGKTVMVLALLDMRRSAESDADRRPSLVVVPRSLIFNWQQEARRFAPRLNIVEYTGTGRAGLLERMDGVDVVLTTYGTVRRDAARLTGRRFDYVVLDEAQAIKNAHTASAKACRLLDGRFRLALSGTPVENHVGELRSLFDFLNPGLFGRALLNGNAGLDEENLAILARGLRPFILRRTKEQVASELPPKLEQTLYCDLDKPQRALYNELRDHYRRALLDDLDAAALQHKKIQVLEALLRLRQAACHPGLIDPKRAADAAAKTDVLLARLRETVDEGHKALVFSQFTSLLALVRRQLDAEHIPYEYLDGRTRDRQTRVERFQSDAACPLFLISLKAGGVGLNLTSADYVFLLDPWWNPAVEAQAVDRTHRIGQTRHVFAYRLIARDTVEERVLELQQRKRRLVHAILTASAGPLQDLRREDLQFLLS